MLRKITENVILTVSSLVASSYLAVKIEYALLQYMGKK